MYTEAPLTETLMSLLSGGTVPVLEFGRSRCRAECARAVAPSVRERWLRGCCRFDAMNAGMRAVWEGERRRNAEAREAGYSCYFELQAAHERAKNDAIAAANAAIADPVE